MSLDYTVREVDADFNVAAGQTDYDVKAEQLEAGGNCTTQLGDDVDCFPDGVTFERVVIYATRQIEIRKNLQTRKPMILAAGVYFASEIESLSNLFIKTPATGADTRITMWLESRG